MAADDIPPLSATEIAFYATHPRRSDIEIAQAAHRIQLINSWGIIKPGNRILEIGCGQGTCTAVLAAAVGPSGHVDAIDPASKDYGAPCTLGEAQAKLSTSEVGERITWHQAEPEEFLTDAAATGGMWDVAVLAHCIWYFSSLDTLRGIMNTLRGRVGSVCIAEYALHATKPEAVPHVLAVLARGMLEAHKETSKENIRSLLSRRAIEDVVEWCGWQLHHSGTVVPGEGLLDGYWEFQTVRRGEFVDEVIRSVGDERTKQALFSAKEATIVSESVLNGTRVRTMDVWFAVYQEECERCC